METEIRKIRSKPSLLSKVNLFLHSFTIFTLAEQHGVVVRVSDSGASVQVLDLTLVKEKI